MAALDRFPANRRTVVYSAGRNRRDEDIVLQGQRLAAAFDRVILYDDSSACDRKNGELRTLFKRGLESGDRVAETLEIPNHYEAMHRAIGLARPGELVLFQTEDSGTDPTVTHFQAWTRMTGQGQPAEGEEQ